MYTGQADELARKIEQSSKILEIDETTGETILHELAKEGKVEILKLLLGNEKIASNMVSYLLWPDKIGWTPVMSATKAGMVFSSTLHQGRTGGHLKRSNIGSLFVSITPLGVLS